MSVIKISGNLNDTNLVLESPNASIIDNSTNKIILSENIPNSGYVNFVLEDATQAAGKAFRYIFKSDNTMDIAVAFVTGGVINGVVDNQTVMSVLQGIPWTESSGKILFPAVFNFAAETFGVNWISGSMALDNTKTHHITAVQFHTFTYDIDTITFTNPPTFTYTPNPSHADYSTSVVEYTEDDQYPMQKTGTVYNRIII